MAAFSAARLKKVWSRAARGSIVAPRARGLDDGFVFRLARAGRHDHGLVVRRQFFIGTIDPASYRHDRVMALFSWSGYPQGGRARSTRPFAYARPPSRELLRRRRFGVGVAAGRRARPQQLDDRTSPVRRSTTVGRLPEKSMKVFSAARCTWRIDGAEPAGPTAGTARRTGCRRYPSG